MWTSTESIPERLALVRISPIVPRKYGHVSIMTSGFDVMAARLTTTQIAATYDLHCFNISVSWVPTGNWQSYSFIIAANAASLADLLRFKKSSSYMDNMMGY